MFVLTIDPRLNVDVGPLLQAAQQALEHQGLVSSGLVKLSRALLAERLPDIITATDLCKLFLCFAMLRIVLGTVVLVCRR